jgi:Ser/Thr protein kinase RdoA (MazF antagonist)
MDDLLQRLVSLVETRWALKCASIEPIKVRENAVYAVHLRDGGKVVLRVHRCGYHSDEALRSERIWMQALGAQGLDVPRHILSSAGNSFEKVRIDGFDGERQVDVFQWIEGRQLGTVEAGIAAQGTGITDVYREVGRLAARLHNHSALWSAPLGFRRHAWDAEGLVGENPFWGRFWELEALSESERKLFTQLRQSLLRELNDFGFSADRYGLIHADLVPENILVDGNRLQVIDFDDAGYGWHLFEIATSLYFIRQEPIYEEARSAVIEGYRDERALSDAHLAKLPMFLAARGSTYLAWVHTRSSEPIAREMTPALIQNAVAAAEEYLRQAR